MPKKSIEPKSKPKREVKTKSIELKAKPLKREKSGTIKKAAEVSPFEKAMEVFGSHFMGAEEKSGFELYQLFRDATIEVFCSSEKKTTFLSGTKEIDFSTIDKFNLIERAYLDNFFVSMAIREKAPEMYPKIVPIIDSYIKPQIKRQGFSAFREEMAGLFVYILTGRQGASSRQLLNAASQMFSISETSVKNTFYRIAKNLKNEKIPLEEGYVSILALYWAINFMGNPEISLGALVKGHKTSERKIKLVEAAIHELNQEVIDTFSPDIRKFAKKYPEGSLSKSLDHYSIDLKNPVPSVFTAFCFLAAFFSVKNLSSAAMGSPPFDFQT